MLRSPRLRLLAGATVILVVAAVLVSLIFITRSSTASRVAATPSPSSATATPSVLKFSRSEAEAAAREWAAGAVMREASKLSTNQIISAFINAWGGQPTADLPGRLNPLIGPPANGKEWIVAVSGSISRGAAWEPLLLPAGNIPWAVITYDATTGQAIDAFTASPSSAVTWPPGWDEIYDLAG